GHQNSESGRLDGVALRLAQILFNLDDQQSIDDFDRLRINALVALCAGSPKVVASYLSDQFYAPYLSVRNRLDALAVLTAASEELSRLKPITGGDTHDKVVVKKRQASLEASSSVKRLQRKYFGLDEDDDDDDEDDEDQGDWRSEIEQRIWA